MVKLFSIIGIPLGWIMYFIYQFVGNYALTLVLFTLLTKLVLVPFAIKQQKSMISTVRIQPKMAELQKKYANNKQKLNEEMMALYQKENYSPFSSCLPLLIQFPILFGLIDVIYYPLKHILHIPADVITKATEIATNVLTAGGMNRYSTEISIINAVNQSPQPFIDAIGPDLTNKIASFDYNLFHISLGAQPTLKPAGDTTTWILLLLIPILSGVTSALMSWLSMKTNKATMGESSGANGMSNGMMMIMPLMSVWISFQVPAGVGFYWLLSNGFACIQTLLLNKYMNPAKLAAQMQAEEEARKEQERQERIEAKKKAREEKTDPETQEKALTQKEINKQKLAAARKRAAQKYGDEYVEATDEDVK